MPRAVKSPQQVAEELIVKAARTAEGCWISHLATNAKGYVPVQLGGRRGEKLRAHRFIWEMFKGPIPEGLHVLHSCDNRNCINYEKHLFLGTPADNTADMMSKGRNKYILPDNRKINSAIFARILDLQEKGFTGRDIAAIIGVSPSTISNYLSGEYHVE